MSLKPNFSNNLGCRQETDRFVTDLFDCQLRGNYIFDDFDKRFRSNDQLKTNTVLQMRDADVEF